MADRKAAFAEWHQGGAISDDNLKQVVNDLEILVDILEALNQRGFFLVGARQQLESAQRMYNARRRDR